MEFKLLTPTDKYHSALVELYIHCFSSGISEQHIDSNELNAYISKIEEIGISVLALENGLIAGAILGYQLSEDTDLPDKIRENYKPEQCLYIAELMVSENFRGRGIGGKLIDKLITSEECSEYSDAFIRVWGQNVTALQLYRKNGFADKATIQQNKRRANGTDTFEMTKIYLHKKLHD